MRARWFRSLYLIAIAVVVVGWVWMFFEGLPDQYRAGTKLGSLLVKLG